MTRNIAHNFCTEVFGPRQNKVYYWHCCC